MSTKYFAENLEGWIAARPENAVSPIDVERAASGSRFLATGFPTTRHEDWKYTNLVPSVRTPFVAADRAHAATVAVPDLAIQTFSDDAWRLVFVNGTFRADLSHLEELPEGLRLLSLSDAITSETASVATWIGDFPDSFSSPLVELNTAHLQDGLFLDVADGIELERPIHLIHIGSEQAATDGGTVSYLRHLIRIGNNAQATLLEEFIALDDAPRMTNVVCEGSVGDGSRFEHVKIQREAKTAVHLAAGHMRLGRDATYANNALAFGAKIARNDPSARLEGEGGHAAIDGLYVVGRDQTLDAHTSIDHTVPNCTSHELYKGILSENGHGVFNGKIFVQPKAQKTDSVQSNMNLLLSDESSIDTKPQLEIFADDVKCTHGATIGRIDDTALFYLRSRGIGKDEAFALLVAAFAAEVVTHIAHEGVREYAGSVLAAELSD